MIYLTNIQPHIRQTCGCNVLRVTLFSNLPRLVGTRILPTPLTNQAFFPHASYRSRDCAQICKTPMITVLTVLHQDVGAAAFS
jgi:hypothetical protein